MTAASSQSVELDEQRSELRSVLESSCFQRAPKLAHLLSYLCEKRFAGETAQIKEYSIGVELFARGESFDQNTDSIVRVEVNRLRKRLAEYYGADRAAHRLKITIPVGQYVPEFVAVDQPLPTSAAELASLPASQSGGLPVDVSRMGTFFRRRRGLAIVLASVIVVSTGLLLFFYGRFVQGRDQAPSRTPVASPGAFSTADSPFGPPPGDEVRILAGAARSFVDHAGKLWSADSWVTGGTAVKGPAQHIFRTLDPDFYRTSRQGDFRYDIPLKKGVYELRLHFAETTFGPESAGGEGSRIMTVRANGRVLLTGFDIAADTGASRTADVKVFPNVEPATDGKLHLEFAGDDGRLASLSAIEITPGTHGQLKPIRLLARQSPYYSNDSRWWSPDNYFEGGQLAAYPTPVSGTDDPELYQTERWGNFSYAIPVSSGKYTVWLHFAARNPKGPSASPFENGARAGYKFNVFCNGKMLLEEFDLPAEARQSDVVIRKFSSLEPNAQGKLLLSFIPVRGYASVAGIEVVPQ